jgi:hypothetical protein
MYNKPKIAREERFWKICTEVETEERVLISCHKYKDIRTTCFQSYGLDLKDSHNTYLLLSKLSSEFLTKVVWRIWEFLVYEVDDLKEFNLCLLYLIDNRE